MFKIVFITFWLLVILDTYAEGCLITNCPRGGKRSEKIAMSVSNIKQCISCGPGHTGQCFGPSICCGPFGCLMGTTETLRCQRDGLFKESEPCIAGGAPCLRNTGRCASENLCCNQESCHIVRQCAGEEKLKPFSDNAMGLELYNLMNFPSDIATDK